MKRAFTLVELVMVIVVMGIISVIGADIISTMYTNYLKSKAINYLQAQSEIALELISKRLSYRVRGSEAVINGANISPLASQQDTDTILTWIGVSHESRNGEWSATNNRFIPGWSGLVDFDHAAAGTINRTIVSPGSHLSIADNIIRSLTNNNVNFANNKIAFIPKTNKTTDISNFYNNTATNYTIRVNRFAGRDDTYQILAIDNLPTYTDGSSGITDEYYLAHTAYALALTGTDTKDMTLWLYYNYEPWSGEVYTDGERNMLAQHVSTFRFLRYGDSIRLKLCLQDANLTTTDDLSACKETVVF